MSRELLESLYEYAICLKSEWGWKEGERAGNAEEYNELLATIEQAEKELAKPDPEPVAWISEALINRFIEIESKGPPLLSSRGYVTNRCLDEDKIPLYRSNSAMKRLSDEEIRAIGNDAFGIDLIFDGRLTDFAKAIETALLEKNK